MLGSYFPGFTMFENRNQYQPFPNSNLFPHLIQNWNSKTSLCFGVKERSKITYQQYNGIYIIYTLVTAVLYTCFSFDIKNPIPCQVS